jgi:hypothetical protein
MANHSIMDDAIDLSEPQQDEEQDDVQPAKAAERTPENKVGGRKPRAAPAKKPPVDSAKKTPPAAAKDKKERAKKEKTTLSEDDLKKYLSYAVRNHCRMYDFDYNLHYSDPARKIIIPWAIVKSHIAEFYAKDGGNIKMIDWTKCRNAIKELTKCAAFVKAVY